MNIRAIKLLSALCCVAMTCTAALAAPGSGKIKGDVNKNLSIFNSLYRELATTYVDTIDSDRAIRTAIDAMLDEIDPYTVYMPADEQDQVDALNTGSYGGIGSVIIRRGNDIILYAPRIGTPSRNAGLRAGDILLKVDDMVITPKTETTEVSKRLRGTPGTQVVLQIKRPYVTDSLLTVPVTRQLIDVDPLPYHGMLDHGIGYINLTTFNANSADAVRNAVEQLRRDNKLKGLILDLRDNGGGIVEAAVQIVGNFVPKGTEVLTIKYREDGDQKVYKTTRKPIDTKLPLVVLINENSASAAEIVAGALQDLDRAVIVGSRSFGKGLVQVSRPLPDSNELKVTVGRYYIPSGRLIQAIDYSHRDANGNVTRIPDSLTNVYHTLAGREVRDGGGITPDVKALQPEAPRLLSILSADNMFYDFANRYFAAHPDLTEAPEVTDSLYAEFKAWIDPSKLHYDYSTEIGMKYLREAAEKEGYMNPEVKEQLDRLDQLLHHDLNRDLDYFGKDIRTALDFEIASRYLNDQQLDKHMMPYDTVIDEAEAVLVSPQRYEMLLTPNKK